MTRPGVMLWLTGAASCTLYGLLYAYEQEIMQELGRTDGWYPLLPVLLALAFSFVHGAFTAYFWDALGVTARRDKT